MMIRRAAAALALAAATALPGSAQDVRVTGITTARYINIRPVVTDSVPADSAPGDGILRRATNGRIVRCTPGIPVCLFLRSADPISSVPIIQDIEATAWGFGRGISVHAHVRGRGAMGKADELWPRADDSFDALAIYGELERDRYRVRAGRQWRSSNLGFYNFDGAAFLFRARDNLSVDVFAGWSLARGLNEARTASALETVEPLVPDDDAYIFGGEVRYQPTRRAALSGTYQREIRGDRAGLFSERLGLDGRYRIGRRGAVSADFEYDVAGDEVNEARLRADFPLPLGIFGEAEVRRYRPFFELWTIWGVFSPVGFEEVMAGASWAPLNGPATIRVRGGWRGYEETNAGLGFAPLRDDGWRIATDGSWRFAAGWTVEGGYRRDIGFGASRGEGDLGVRRDFGNTGYVALHGIAFEQVQEFRVDDGTVLGVGTDASVRIGSQARIGGGVAAYRHETDEGDAAVNWTQIRGLLRLEWTLGRDPGLRGRREGTP